MLFQMLVAVLASPFVVIGFIARTVRTIVRGYRTRSENERLLQGRLAGPVTKFRNPEFLRDFRAATAEIVERRDTAQAKLAVARKLRAEALKLGDGTPWGELDRRECLEQTERLERETGADPEEAAHDDLFEALRSAERSDLMWRVQHGTLLHTHFDSYSDWIRYERRLVYDGEFLVVQLRWTLERDAWVGPELHDINGRGGPDKLSTTDLAEFTDEEVRAAREYLNSPVGHPPLERTAPDTGVVFSPQTHDDRSAWAACHLPRVDSAATAAPATIAAPIRRP
jgi:hypothetical protein